MNFIIVLIILQAISCNCVPFERRKTCGNPTTITNVITVAQSATTVTIEPASVLPAQPSSSAIDAQGGVFAQISTSAVVPGISVITTAVPSGTAQVLPSLSTQTPDTTGSVGTSLQTSGVPTAGPIISTSITAPTSLIAPVASASSVVSFTPSSAMVARNIFQPVATNAPPLCIKSRPDHPVPRLGIESHNCPLSTNKFYANFFLGSQSAPTLTHPYSVSWAKGGGSSRSWGISISHIDANQRVFGPDPNANPAGYFINPVGIQSIVLSAAELGSSTTLTTDSLTALSVNVNLLSKPAASPAVTFPLVQGMGFVTAIYNGGTPFIQTGVFFRNIARASYAPKYGMTKYTILLEDGKTWLLYAYSPRGAPLNLQVVNNGLAQSTSTWHGIIQIGKNPCGATCEALYDAACGAYPTTATLSGSVSGRRGTYSMSFAKAGLTNSTLVMFALPHHLQSFDSATNRAVSDVQLQTTTKGTATAVLADSWILVEPDMPVDMGFAPWRPGYGSQSELSPNAIAAIHNAAASEVSQNITQQTDLNSFYYSGKALAKFASIIYTINDLAKNPSLAQAGLSRLKTAFELFSTNTNQFPLVYESAWGGVVSSGSYVTGDPGVDFGNTYYNDHHFHFGYFIYTAAIIGYLDPSWLPANKDYVNTLVRDIANPSSADPYFPVDRMFDWYHGHSWAHGLYESYDGKDEESTSEDSMSAYALKMWGRTVGDANLEARGNLQLAITARSLQSYFLYTSDNTIQPANFVGNKVSGILFENKIDHTTYFGSNIEYIQGIHMLPFLPSSALTRTKRFVQEEWDAHFGGGRADAVQGGWKGILYANLATVDPVASFQFFNSSSFDAGCLDGGASRTWYLALAAGLGGAP